MGELRKCFAHRLGVERKVLLRAENPRKEIRDQLSHHHVGVGDRQRSTAAVAFRPGIGARAVGPDPEACAVEMQERPAARRHGMNEHHRGAHAHAGNLGLERAFVLAVEVRDVGRGAAHVEADQVREARLASALRHADHAGGRPGQNRILALEQLRGSEAAGGHHEHEAGNIVAIRYFSGAVTRRGHGRPRVLCAEVFGAEVFGAEIPRHLTDILPQDRRKIGIDDGGVAAADQLDERRDLVAHRHLRKADLARERGHALLVLGVAIGVHEHDRDRLDAVGACGRKLPAQRRQVGLVLDRAVGAHALVHFDDALVEHLRFDDVACENLRPRLVADLERVAKTLGGDEQGTLALALEQRIGRDRGAHLHSADQTGGQRLVRFDAEEVADALYGGIAIGLGIVGEKFVGNEAPVGPAPDHVGEGAAAVDPKIPGVGVLRAVHPDCRPLAEPSHRGACARRRRPSTPHCRCPRVKSTAAAAT